MSFIGHATDRSVCHGITGIPRDESNTGADFLKRETQEPRDKPEQQEPKKERSRDERWGDCDVSIETMRRIKKLFESGELKLDK
jgi:hypothetical protein